MAEKAKEEKQESPLVAHARREMEFVGLFDEDSDYNGMIANAVMELMKVFSGQGHSGFSANLTMSLWYRLAQNKPLTALTNDPEEWMEVTETMYTEEQKKSGMRIWQNRRSPSVFSTDEGKTWKDYETNIEGKSVSKEEALNGVDEENQQGKQKASGVSGESSGGPQAESTTGVQGQSATESSDSQASSSGEKSQDLERSESPVEGNERSDSSQPRKTEAQGGASSKKTSKKGGAQK